MNEFEDDAYARTVTYEVRVQGLNKQGEWVDLGIDTDDGFHAKWMGATPNSGFSEFRTVRITREWIEKVEVLGGE